uniref:Myb/SANT-like DNA-binding domain-containing protein n=1 Tax=Mus spicilegus TaxID=10103 RepID=A0A8C6HPD9_MUSSI
MESGPGKHWTEEEVKALLSVWAERNIRKQLYRTLRNKEIFIYVAKRLRSLGVYRDWKQCRAKYKNLKYEYRTVKHAHRSGDSSRTMKFFHALDAILQSEPTAQLTEEEDGCCSKCLATLSPVTAPEIAEVTAGEVTREDSVSNISEDSFSDVKQCLDTGKVKCSVYKCKTK